MTKQETLSQMMREEHDVIDINFYSLAALFAEKLAALGDRLDEDELDVFIGIGKYPDLGPLSLHRSRLVCIPEDVCFISYMFLRSDFER